VIAPIEPNPTPATRPASGGSVWAYVSPTRLNCWLTCPLRFKLRYLDGVRTPPTPSLLLGQHVHYGLEHWYRQRMDGCWPPLEPTLAAMDQQWDRAVFDGVLHLDCPREEKALRRQATDLVRAYLEQIPGDEPPPLGVEMTLEAPLVDPETGAELGMPLLGIADLVLPGPGGPVIIDFKTTARASAPMEIAHEIQLSCYAWLYRRLSGQIESGLEIRSLVKTRQPKVETHRYPARTDGDFQRLFAVIREYLAALDAGRFNFRPGFSCTMCELRDPHCRDWAG